jgi:hypothetical protein
LEGLRLLTALPNSAVEISEVVKKYEVTVSEEVMERDVLKVDLKVINIGICNVFRICKKLITNFQFNK